MDVTNGKNTHQEIGRDLKLFFMDDTSPGSPFFLPKGAHIYNKLISFMRKQYKHLNYQEVITPNIFDKKLWMISGHWDKYKENMFVINKERYGKETKDESKEQSLNTNPDDEKEFSLKPMQCPSHCVMFQHLTPSYRDLPLRLADFGVLHRNEATGALRGLTRARKFSQDDAHLFCALDQIDKEIETTLDLLSFVYNKFNFTFEVGVSTRPDNYIGDIKNWDLAEDILKKHASKFNFHIKEKDGAFYGPKIDIHIKDALDRLHQCGTIQLDFNLPERFDLKYTDKDNSFKRPVIIHRAIFGSLERFIAILLEHTQGDLPFWLSPRQIMIIPIKTEKHLEYCMKLKNQLSDYEVDIDDSSETLNKKIFNAETMKYNYIIVVGNKEIKNNVLTIRYNNGKDTVIHQISTNDVFAQFKNENEY